MSCLRVRHCWCPCSGTAALLLAAASSALANPALPFPSQDSLRQAQLAALACARENSADSCQRSRALADPLLDHPRLPTACKDLLWSIRERSLPAAVNSFERREGLVQPAQGLLRVCRTSEKPSTEAPKPQQPAGGGGLQFSRP
jgi:hypothetical protein